VSLNRYAKRTDSTQNAIVRDLRRCGVTVWIISRPCDLLTFWAGRWLPLEVKPLKAGKVTDAQSVLAKNYAVPIVHTFEEALAAVKSCN
jgi:hypothetical protein